MLSFLSFLLLGAIAFFLWKISEQLPDVLYRLSEIQRDVSALADASEPPPLPEPEAARVTETDADDDDD